MNAHVLLNLFKQVEEAKCKTCRQTSGALYHLRRQLISELTYHVISDVMITGCTDFFSKRLFYFTGREILRRSLNF